VKLQPLAVRDSGDLKMAFDAATREGADALLVVREASFTAIRHQIADFAARRRLPAIYGGLVYVETGALMSYGANILDMLRRLGGYVNKILKGAKPADLPVEQPGHQHEDRQGPRADDPANAAPACRSGHRIARARPTKPASESSTRIRWAPC
jgi:ABC-type uncharacterized transport system substrate-binding protein